MTRSMALLINHFWEQNWCSSWLIQLKAQTACPGFDWRLDISNNFWLRAWNILFIFMTAILIPVHIRPETTQGKLVISLLRQVSHQTQQIILNATAYLSSRLVDLLLRFGCYWFELDWVRSFYFNVAFAMNVGTTGSRTCWHNIRHQLTILF